MTVNDVLQVLNWLYQDPELPRLSQGVGEGGATSDSVACSCTCFNIHLCSDFAWEKESSLVTQISLISETALFGSPPTPQPSGVSLRLGHLYLSRTKRRPFYQEHMLT